MGALVIICLVVAWSVWVDEERAAGVGLGKTDLRAFGGLRKKPRAFPKTSDGTVTVPIFTVINAGH